MPRIYPGCTVAIVALLGCVTSLAEAASAPKVTKADFAAIFQRDPVKSVTLSPDGRYLAYSVRDGTSERLMLVEVERPGNSRWVSSSPLRFVGWTNNNILVYAPPNEVRGINADGSNDRKLVNRDDIAVYVGINKVPRIPQVVGIVPALPGSVLVTAKSSTVDYYLVDATTGALNLTDYRMSGEGGRGYADQQGKIRAWDGPSQVRRVAPGHPPVISWISVPVHMQFRAVAESGWHDFDQTIGAEAGVRFENSAEDYYGERSLPLGFDSNPNILYFASNVKRDTFGIYALDIGGKKRTAFAVEDAHLDLAAPDDVFSSKVLVFDRSGKLSGLARPDGTSQWFDPALDGIQKRLDAKFSGRTVRLIEWNTERDRVLVSVSSAADPGRYFVFDANAGEPAEFLRRNGSLPLDHMGTPSSFEFDAMDGTHLTGTLTQPRNPTLTPPPLVLYVRDFPAVRPPGGFDPDVQALAAMGFVVAEVNHRGTIGFGQRHRDAIKEGLDRIPLEDLNSTMNWISEHQKVDLARIAIVGEGMGGYIAVRALEVYPERFRCAVAINSPMSPADWAYGSQGDDKRPDDAAIRGQSFLRQIPNLGRISAFSDAGLITKPVLLMREPSRNDISYRQAEGMRNALRSRGGDVAYESLTNGFSARDPNARAAAYVKIADFMRAALYDFNVNIGPTRVVK